jgi:hypothetical protein
MQLAILAGYYTALNDKARIAGVLRKPEDHSKYHVLAASIAKEFNDRFHHVDASGPFYGSDSETSNAMALDAGLVAPSELVQVRERLAASVRRADNHITSGSVGLGPLFRALQAASRNDLLYDMIVNPTTPVEIVPSLVGDFKQASGTYATPRGDIRSAWKKALNGE